jgi:hypothetical protein
MDRQGNNGAAGGPSTKKARDHIRNRWISDTAATLERFKENFPDTVPVSPALESETVPGQENWSEQNLPEILF